MALWICVKCSGCCVKQSLERPAKCLRPTLEEIPEWNFIAMNDSNVGQIILEMKVRGSSIISCMGRRVRT